MSMTRIRARAEARGTYVHTQTTRSDPMLRTYVPCATVDVDSQRCIVRYVRTYIHRDTHGITRAHGRTYGDRP